MVSRIEPRIITVHALTADSFLQANTHDAEAFAAEAVTWDSATWFPTEHLASVEIPMQHLKQPTPEDGLHVIKEQGGMWTKNMKLNISQHGVQLKEIIGPNIIGVSCHA
jgi:hypothetical protein